MFQRIPNPFTGKKGGGGGGRGSAKTGLTFESYLEKALNLILKGMICYETNSAGSLKF